MPLLGGLVIVSGVTLMWALVFLFRTEWILEITGILLAVLLVFLLGFFDDIRQLRPEIRLLGQVAASLVVIFIGRIVFNVIPFWFISIPITLFYLVAAINSLNLLDGIDGIATGSTLVAAGGFFVVFSLDGNYLGTILSLALAGVTAGFLIFNFNPAKIFLGDSGSTVLGLLLGILAVLFSSRSYSLVHFFVPILILIVPILDTGTAIIRRKLQHRPIFSGDRDHLYDLIIKMGFSQKLTCLIFYLFGIVGSSIAYTILALK